MQNHTYLSSNSFWVRGPVRRGRFSAQVSRGRVPVLARLAWELDSLGENLFLGSAWGAVCFDMGELWAAGLGFSSWSLLQSLIPSPLYLETSIQPASSSFSGSTLWTWGLCGYILLTPIIQDNLLF